MDTHKMAEANKALTLDFNFKMARELKYTRNIGIAAH
jgi:hypothetical protein